MFMWRREEQEVGSYCLEDKNSCLFFPHKCVIDTLSVKPCALPAFSFDTCYFCLDQKHGL